MATLAFVAVSAGIAAASLFWIWVIAVGLCALAVSPPLWWKLVGRNGRPKVGRGAAAGALSTLAAFGIPLVFEVVWFYTRRDFGLGAFGEFLHFWVVLGVAAVAAGVNAALGAALVRIGQRAKSPHGENGQLGI